MPVHDWTRVDAGLFHHFHQRWAAALSDALNSGGLPPEYFALVEQRIRGPIPDVLTLRLGASAEGPIPGNGTVGLAVATTPPRARRVSRRESEDYARKADRIAVRHRHGEVVAVIEIISPGNKASRSEFRSLLEKSTDLIRQGVHLLVIDLFPPGPRNPKGIHPPIWDTFREDGEEEVGPPPGKPLTLASYDAGPGGAAYAEWVAVADDLPEMPLFLAPEFYVPAPLESSYRTAWEVFPAALKPLLAPRE